MSYTHPLKRVVRGLLGLRPCPCGCNLVYVRRSARDFSELGRVSQWATRDGDGCDVPTEVETWPIIEHEPEHEPDVPPDLGIDRTEVSDGS